MLLAASLHVALDELLGVLLEDVVDLVQQVVEVFLELLALLGQLTASRPGVVAALRGLVGLVSFFFCSAMDCVPPGAPRAT